MRFQNFCIAVCGTIVEYYDYSLYGFCAAVIATHFFPQGDPTVALLQTFGVFATGSMAKPIGSLIFGRLGDRRGRKRSLSLSMLGIAVPTAIVGLLPSYQHWGWISPAILLCCRILQGMFVAGEYDGVVIYVLEHVKSNRACLANSLIGVAAFIGIYLASLAVTMTSLPFVPDWMWRLPFLIGGALGLVTLLLRRFLHETPQFESYQRSDAFQSKQGLIRTLASNWQSLLVAIVVCGAAGGCYHFYFIFLKTYLTSVLGLVSDSTASFYTTVNLLIYILASPLAGMVADTYGVVRTLQTASWVLIVAILVNCHYLYYGQLSWMAVSMVAVIMPFFVVPGHVLLVGLFKVGERYQCLSFGHTVGSMLLSGSAPFIGLLIWQQTQLSIAPFLYSVLMIALVPATLFIVRTKLYMRENQYFHKSFDYVGS